MLSIVHLNVLDTIVISPRMSGVNNDFSECQQLWVTVSVPSCCVWDCVWLGLYLVVNFSGAIFQALFFSVLEGPYNILCLSPWAQWFYAFASRS